MSQLQNLYESVLDVKFDRCNFANKMLKQGILTEVNVGEIYDTAIPLKNDEWTEISITFNSGDNTSVELFFGTWGHAGLTIYIDDVNMTPTE